MIFGVAGQTLYCMMPPPQDCLKCHWCDGFSVLKDIDTVGGPQVVGSPKITWTHPSWCRVGRHRASSSLGPVVRRLEIQPLCPKDLCDLDRVHPLHHSPTPPQPASLIRWEHLGPILTFLCIQNQGNQKATFIHSTPSATFFVCFTLEGIEKSCKDSTEDSLIGSSPSFSYCSRVTWIRHDCHNS